jgi:hypothetical protein
MNLVFLSLLSLEAEERGVIFFLSEREVQEIHSLSRAITLCCRIAIAIDIVG